ncbi:MAG TPA: glycosyltransferase family 4 protein [Methanoculleus thermophilus]|nr:glycosyltransferase family 4 protein [Bacillota bacterium]HQD27086.1 glycosyltransferase family 4 protein [Methanoculleus thermophilus]
MKVLMVAGDNPHAIKIGGKHIHQLLLEKGLTSQGIDVDAVYPRFSDSRSIRLLEYIKHGLLAGNPTQFIPPDKLQVISIVNQLRNALASIDIDSYSVVHCHDVVSAYAFRQAFPHATLPKILTLHGYFAREAVDYSRIRTDRAKKVFFDFCYAIEEEGVRWSDRIICVDTRLRDYVDDTFSYPSAHISVVQNATDTDLFCPILEEENAQIREEMGYSEDQFIIIVPRRLVPKNGVQFAILAMKYILDNNVRLLVLGDGPQYPELAALAQGDARVQFLGAVPHEFVERYYKISNVVLIPSITSHGVQEATSLSMLEGMACGKIVICSSIGGMREVLQDDVTGYLVSERNPEEIAGKINSILKGSVDIESMGRRAREYVVEHHSYIPHAVLIRNVYETACPVNQE